VLQAPRIGRLLKCVSKEGVTGRHECDDRHCMLPQCLRDFTKGVNMARDGRDLLEMLKFELRFLESGGYKHSPRTPWRAMSTFLDSPTCLNFNDRTRPHPCTECLLLQFVPAERKTENSPCWFIPLTAVGETVNYYAHCGTQLELEKALAAWLRSTMRRLERQHAGPEEGSAEREPYDVKKVAKA